MRASGSFVVTSWSHAATYHALSGWAKILLVAEVGALGSTGSSATRSPGDRGAAAVVEASELGRVRVIVTPYGDRYFRVTLPIAIGIG